MSSWKRPWKRGRVGAKKGSDGKSLVVAVGADMGTMVVDVGLECREGFLRGDLRRRRLLGEKERT